MLLFSLDRIFVRVLARPRLAFSKNKKRFPLLYLLFILLVLQLREGGRERGNEATSLVFFNTFFLGRACGERERSTKR